MPASSSSLQPTWHGYVSTTQEALILFECAISNRLQRVVRRPHDRERGSLIKSGNVFIYEESASGIKRWTDGVPWSPSRILNNFLIYRELEKPFPPGEKKRAAKKIKSPKRPGEPYAKPDGSDDSVSYSSPTTPIGPSPTTPLSARSEQSSVDRDAERQLVGSLTDSYQFKEGGLVKKTMSVNVDGVHYHLVSYYQPEEVKAGLLPTPLETDLRDVKVRPDLIHRQNFRAPIEDAEDNMQSPVAGGAQPPMSSYMAMPSTQYTHIPGPQYMPPQQSISPGGHWFQSVGRAPSYQFPTSPHQTPPPPQPQPQYQQNLSHHHHAQHHGYIDTNGRPVQNGYYQNVLPTAMHIKTEYNGYPPYAQPRPFQPSDDYGAAPGMTGWPSG